MKTLTKKFKPLLASFLFLLLVAFSLPIVTFHYFGLDLMILTQAKLHDTHIQQLITQQELYAYIRLLLLQWSTFSLTIIIIFLALIQYFVTRDKIIFGFVCGQVIIGTYFFFHPFSSLHTLGYCVQLFIYFLPFACLCIHAFFAYNRLIQNHQALESQQKKLHYNATHDDLTGLYNRQQFIDLLGQSLIEHQRLKHHFALYLIDIDDFKQINDNFGHARGDELIHKFALQLSALTRYGDIFARLSGDEFALLTLNIKSLQAAENIANRLTTGLKMAYFANSDLITSSIGVAIYPFDGSTSEELLKNADTAMYQAKKNHKNTYQFYSQRYGFD